MSELNQQIVPAAEQRATSSRTWFERLIFGMLCLSAGLLIAYLIFRPDNSGSGTPDLLALAASRADLVELDANTGDPAEAESYILGEFGWPVTVPSFPESHLVGVGVDELVAGIELPVLRYNIGEQSPVTVFVFDYAFLDDASGRLSLSPAVYARLAEDESVDVRRTNDEYVVLWRNRAVVYAAIVHDDPDPLVESLQR